MTTVNIPRKILNQVGQDGNITRGDRYMVDGEWKTVGYAQPVDLPVKVSSVVTANNVRVGAGTDIFEVKGGGFITRSTLTQTTVSGMGNGDQVVNQVQVTNLNDKSIIAIVERTVYVDNYGVAADCLIGGSNIDESQWQIIGSNFSIIDTGGDTTPADQLTNHLYIRDISAGNVTLYIDAYVRYIINTNAN